LSFPVSCLSFFTSASLSFLAHCICVEEHCNGKIILWPLYPLLRCTCDQHVGDINLDKLADLVVALSVKHVEPILSK